MNMKIMTKITTILILSIFLFGCKKECHTLTEFVNSKPIPPTTDIVGYDQLECDMFRIIIFKNDGSKKIIIMNFNHQIISEQ